MQLDWCFQIPKWNIQTLFCFKDYIYRCMQTCQKASSDLNPIPPLARAMFSRCRIRRAKRGQHSTATSCQASWSPAHGSWRTTPRTCSAFKLWQVFETRCFILNYERLQQYPSLRTSQTNSLNKNNQSVLNQHVRQQLLIIYAIVTA